MNREAIIEKGIVIEPNVLLANTFIELLNSTSQCTWHHLTTLFMLEHHEMSTYRYLLVNMSLQEGWACALLHQVQKNYPEIKLYLYGTNLLPETKLYFDCFSELSEVYHRYFAAK